MDALGDLLAGPHADTDDRTALRAPGDPSRSYGYRKLATTARKTGNFLRHLGVGDSATVAVTADPTPESLLTLFGTALLGGCVWFDPHEKPEAKALVAPLDALAHYDLPPGGTYVAYGAPSEDPSVAFFEREVWSENPGFPNVPVDSDAPLLTTGDATYTHRRVLDAAGRVADRLDADDEVAVRSSLARPETVTAGVAAPLLAGATVLLPDDETVGTVAVAESDAPEDTVVGLDDVTL